MLNVLVVRKYELEEKEKNETNAPTLLNKIEAPRKKNAVVDVRHSVSKKEISLSSLGMALAARAASIQSLFGESVPIERASYFTRDG